MLATQLKRRRGAVHATARPGQARDADMWSWCSRLDGPRIDGRCSTTAGRRTGDSGRFRHPLASTDSSAVSFNPIPQRDAGRSLTVGLIHSGPRRAWLMGPFSSDGRLRVKPESLGSGAPV